MYRYAIVFCSAALMCASDAPAQGVSDLELQAAYCLGVVTEQFEESRMKKGKAAVDISTIIDERRQRFRDYLLVKGFLGGRDTNAMKVALQRGPKDAKTCAIEVKEDFFKSCSVSCQSKFRLDFQKVMACTSSCPQPDACVRVKKCLENFLPF